MIFDGNVRLTHLWEHVELSETLKSLSNLKHLIFSNEQFRGTSMIIDHTVKRNLFLIQY